MKKSKMKRRIAHLEHRLFQELPVLQLENDLLRAGLRGKAVSIPARTPAMTIVNNALRDRVVGAQRGGYPGYYPDPQPDQEC